MLPLTTTNVRVLPDWSITSGSARKCQSASSSVVTFRSSSLASAFTCLFLVIVSIVLKRPGQGQNRSYSLILRKSELCHRRRVRLLYSRDDDLKVISSLLMMPTIPLEYAKVGNCEIVNSGKFN